MEKPAHDKSISVGNFRCYACPVGAIEEQSLEYIELYHNCREFSCLPRPGGLSEQDNKTFEAFSIIRGEYIRIDDEHRKEQERKVRHHARN